MSLIQNIDEVFHVEDTTYVSNALTHCKFAKEFSRIDHFEQSIFHFRKAAKIVE
jgi:hypothetical protein